MKPVLTLITVFLNFKFSESHFFNSSDHRRNLLKAESIRQTVNHDEVLSLSPSKTAAKDLESHVNAAADVKMWAPLWPQPHRAKENAVFGLALGYDTRHFYWFVGSLRKVGFRGDVVLATKSAISADLVKFLKETQVITYPL